MSLAQSLVIFPSNKAAIEYANGTVKPTYPRYNNGGWKARPGSCNTGFKPFPSDGIGLILVKGLDVKIVNPIKPTLTIFVANKILL